MPPAEGFVALNVALYGAAGKRWAMTERSNDALQRSTAQLGIGPSRLHWEGDCLVIDIHETTVPLPSRLRGRVRLHAHYLWDRPFDLDLDAHHQWCPIAPRARIEVQMQQPALRWQGDAYFDSNWGDEPLEERFDRWDWSRAMLANGGCGVLYHAGLRDQPVRSLGLCFDSTGRISRFEPPPDRQLPKTAIWRIERASQCEKDGNLQVRKTLEDTPFYARSIIDTQLLGERVTAMHESLSLARFRQPWVKLLLPFRMPRRARYARG